MTDNLRDHINRRSRKAMIQSGAKIGRLSDAEAISPSERKSQLLRKKLSSRDGHKPDAAVVPIDCRDCPKLPCSLDSNTCTEKLWTWRCQMCGAKVRYRLIEGDPWVYCPACRTTAGLKK